MYQPTTLPRLQRGMTVLEVAGVIVILAVVAAILFPVFARPHSVGRISCISNVKQLGLAIMQYEQDYDQTLPPRNSTVAGKPVTWRSNIYLYLKSTGVYRCPTNSFADLPDFEHDGFPRSYAADGTLGGSFGDDHPYLTTSRLKSPATVILICESTSSFGDFDPLKPNFFARQAREGRNGGCMQTHLGRSNFLFADGHARVFNPLMTIGASAQEPLNYWTIDNHSFSRDDLKTAQYTLGYAIERGQKQN